jgi:tRNA-2-methylthio-N6-dimethylallyladenosine synthase
MTALVGTVIEVLVEGRSRTNEAKRFGRTPQNRVVNFDGTAPAGSLCEVKITSASHSALSGAELRLLSLPKVAIVEPARSN